MCLSVTYIWFSIPLLLVLVALHRETSARILGFTLQLLGGPILLIMNVLGCISNSISFDSYCIKKTNCNSDVMVISLKTITWGFLYLISLLFTFSLVVQFLNYCKKKRLQKKVKNWRKSAKVGSALLESSCCICLESFRKGEKINTLPNCKHSFHLECIDIWMTGHDTCPICRRQYN